MFENAGFIKKQCKDYSCTVCEQYNNCEKYPPFTAEKQITELCKRDKNFCISCRSKAECNIDFIECIEGGRAQLSQDILQLLQIKEVE